MAYQIHKRMLTEALDKCEADAKDAWWWLNLHLMEPYSGGGFESNIKLLPGWQNADQETQKRIVNAAKNYLSTAAIRDDRWFCADSIFPPVFVGYRALFLLFQEEPEYVHSLPIEMWAKWASTIVAYPIWTETFDEEPYCQLTKLAYQKVPASVCRYILRVIDYENNQGRYASVLKRLTYCLDEFLLSLLGAKLMDRSLTPEYFGYLLEELLYRGSDKARSYAESVVANKDPLQSNDKATVAARALSRQLTNKTWSVIWKRVISDSQFGRPLLTDIADENHGEFKAFLAPLSENQLAELYIWLEQQFSHKEDTYYEGFHGIGPDESVRSFRHYVLEELKAKGTLQAVSEMKRIVATFPEIAWQRQKMLEAQAQMRLSTWEPLQPEIILALASSPQKRLVQNGEQLLNVIIESLKRLEQKLREDTAVIYLWNQFKRAKKTVFRPKDENDFSHYVKIHLVDDLKGRGIIVNREVVIRPTVGLKSGERTDIQIDAITKDRNDDPFDKVSVIIETKGCWHAELKTAAETQLKDRYLKDNSCRYGLYLVGWFCCDQWDSLDSRKKKSPKISLENAQKLFEAQAAELSANGLLIKAYVMNTAL